MKLSKLILSIVMVLGFASQSGACIINLGDGAFYYTGMTITRNQNLVNNYLSQAWPDLNVNSTSLRSEVEVLTNGVGGSSVPVLTDSLLGRHHLQKMPEFTAEDVPAFFDVIGEGLGFVLREDDDLVNPGVHAVAEGEVHKAVDPAERDGGLGAILGEGHEPLPPSSSHDKRKGVFHIFDLPWE